MIKPISTFDAYFHKTENKKLYGIDLQGVKEIEIIDQDGDEVVLLDFFTKAGAIYFSVNEVDTVEVDGQTVTETINNFYKQDGETVTKISALPDRPVQSRISYEHAEFSIKEATWNGGTYTDVKNLTVTSGIERFAMVPNFYHFTGQGIFVHVSDGRYNEVVTVRDKGLYFWGTNDRAISYIIQGEGVMWK